MLKGADAAGHLPLVLEAKSLVSTPDFVLSFAASLLPSLTFCSSLLGGGPGLVTGRVLAGFL